MIVTDPYGHRAEIDVEATRAYYDGVVGGEADGCHCGTCANYVRVRHALPAWLREAVEPLGIDVEKEWEAYDLGPVPPDMHRYGGWFVVVGTSLDEPEPIDPQRGRAIPPLWSFDTSFPAPMQLDMRDVAVHFMVELPWVMPPMICIPE